MTHRDPYLMTNVIYSQWPPVLFVYRDGGTAELTCDTLGSPLPTVSWMYSMTLTYLCTERVGRQSWPVTRWVAPCPPSAGCGVIATSLGWRTAQQPPSRVGGRGWCWWMWPPAMRAPTPAPPPTVSSIPRPPWTSSSWCYVRITTNNNNRQAQFVTIVHAINFKKF